MKSGMLGWLAALPLALLSGCSPAPDAPATSQPLPAVAVLADAPVSEALTQLTTDVAHDVCKATIDLQHAAQAFIAQPESETLQAARAAWQTTHQHLRALSALYALAGLPMPHLSEDGRDTLTAHPLLPGYLDRVPGWPSSGLVHSGIDLTLDFLRQDHQAFDFYNLTLGLHPIEFMLWGEDESTAERLAAFQDPAEPESDRIAAEARRRQLLTLMASALVEDSALLCDDLMTGVLAQQLANLKQQDELLASRYHWFLEHYIEAPAALLATYPEGVDEQGMPVWRAAFARTDQEDLADLRQRLQGWQDTLQLKPSADQAP